LPEKQVIISYPNDGSVDIIGGGKTIVNFRNGVVTRQDGTTGNMSASLTSMRVPWIRSIFVFTGSDDITATLQPVGVTLQLEPCSLAVFNDVEIDLIEINCPSGRVPDRFDFYLIASNSPFSYDPIFFKVHDAQYNSITTTDAYQTVLSRHTVNFGKQSFKIKNTGSNNATIDLQFRESTNSNAGFDSAVGFSRTLNNGDTLWLNVDTPHHLTRLRAQSAVAGSSTTVTLEWIAQL